MAYIETSNLDGETNLKIRQVRKKNSVLAWWSCNCREKIIVYRLTKAQLTCSLMTSWQRCMVKCKVSHLIDICTNSTEAFLCWDVKLSVLVSYFGIFFKHLLLLLKNKNVTVFQGPINYCCAVHDWKIRNGHSVLCCTPVLTQNWCWTQRKRLWNS